MLADMLPHHFTRLKRNGEIICGGDFAHVGLEVKYLVGQVGNLARR
jgi:hypothetical protein